MVNFHQASERKTPLYYLDGYGKPDPFTWTVLQCFTIRLVTMKYDDDVLLLLMMMMMMLMMMTMLLMMTTTMIITHQFLNEDGFGNLYVAFVNIFMIENTCIIFEWVLVIMLSRPTAPHVEIVHGSQQLKSGGHIQYIPWNMHTVLLCFALLWLCNRS